MVKFSAGKTMNRRVYLSSTLWHPLFLLIQTIASCKQIAQNSWSRWGQRIPCNLVVVRITRQSATVKGLNSKSLVNYSCDLSDIISEISYQCMCVKFWERNSKKRHVTQDCPGIFWGYCLCAFFSAVWDDPKNTDKQIFCHPFSPRTILQYLCFFCAFFPWLRPDKVFPRICPLKFCASSGELFGVDSY